MAQASEVLDFFGTPFYFYLIAVLFSRNSFYLVCLEADIYNISHDGPSLPQPLAPCPPEQRRPRHHLRSHVRDFSVLVLLSLVPDGLVARPDGRPLYTQTVFDPGGEKRGEFDRSPAGECISTSASLRLAVLSSSELRITATTFAVQRDKIFFTFAEYKFDVISSTALRRCGNCTEASDFTKNPAVGCDVYVFMKSLARCHNNAECLAAEDDYEKVLARYELHDVRGGNELREVRGEIELQEVRGEYELHEVRAEYELREVRREVRGEVRATRIAATPPDQHTEVGNCTLYTAVLYWRYAVLWAKLAKCIYDAETIL